MKNSGKSGKAGKSGQDGSMEHPAMHDLARLLARIAAERDHDAQKPDTRAPASDEK